MTSPHLRPGPQSADLFRRLRAWSVSSWRHGDRIALTRAAALRLAGLASSADGHIRPAVPDAGVHALVDQLEVLRRDALDAGADGEQVQAVLLELALGLGLGPGKR